MKNWEEKQGVQAWPSAAMLLGSGVGLGLGLAGLLWGRRVDKQLEAIRSQQRESNEQLRADLALLRQLVEAIPSTEGVALPVLAEASAAPALLTDVEDFINAARAASEAVPASNPGDLEQLHQQYTASANDELYLLFEKSNEPATDKGERLL